jgi:hypothetical protein
MVVPVLAGRFTKKKYSALLYEGEKYGEESCCYHGYGKGLNDNGRALP